MKSFLSFINIDFLVKKDSIKNWRMIIYLSLLALITIYSGHSTDRKVYKVSSLKKEINILNNEFVSSRTLLMKIKMESRVTKILNEKGLVPSEYPPIKINKRNIITLISIQLFKRLFFIYIYYIYLKI